MKANELMIGDWICSSINDINVRIAPADLNWDNAHTEWLANSKPIPLTAEILEKNGFKKHNRYQYIYKDNYCKVCVLFAPRIEVDGMDLGEPPINISIEGALFDINMSISEIHELQHALRLCGIDKEIVL